MASMYTNAMVLLDGYMQKRDSLAVEVASLRVENTFLRSNSPGLQHTWGPYTPPWPQNQPALECVVTKEMLQETLRGHSADIDESFALSKASDFPSRERTHAQQIVGTQLFQEWIASLHSTKLLMLRDHPRFISLIWLCGLHLDPDESSVGGNSMLSSFIDQLLRQHEFDLGSMTTTGAVDINLLQSGDDKELFRLLYFLTLQIPYTITLVAFIDNVVFYEREMNAFDALIGLLGLVNERLPAAVKLLFTSTPGTTGVRGAFEDEGLILNVDTLPSLVWALSDERIARKLEDTVQE
ncbi:hypothetical protein CGCSCA4_v000496 [Colletotrichum siamense]|nr:hypothetical protein CGCSCA4_v000496 [Colletotrichum siamense]